MVGNIFKSYRSNYINIELNNNNLLLITHDGDRTWIGSDYAQKYNINIKVMYVDRIN